MSLEPRILICGSMAFDTICVFQGKFGEHIVPEATHKISVSFMVDQMRREFGGCAGNVAYSLKVNVPNLLSCHLQKLPLLMQL